MIENGVSEEEAVAHQGGTKEIAEEILRENAVKREFKIGWIGTVLIILTLLCGMVSGYLMYQEYQISRELKNCRERWQTKQSASLEVQMGPTVYFWQGKSPFQCALIFCL